MAEIRKGQYEKGKLYFQILYGHISKNPNKILTNLT